ncbi:uncharacterized hydrolase YugF isoform X2 [Manihot esculenta]|uniref:AB hydrolase-1 domain-containing protein n=1 Tax=Manihot esculenta TaxID=3983 RepID=A0A2C9UET9_MANES|nr:uncharacterized hydrolase YugF isoform X2 [Manihot esculenta]
MSSTSTHSFSLTKPEFSCLLPQRRNGRCRIQSPILPSKIHLHGLSISRGISKLSGFKSNGFLVHYFSSDFSVDNQGGVEKSASSDTAKKPEVQSSIWKWKGYSIRYQYSGNSGPALVLVHGFGANSDHWRKNIPVLAKKHRTWATQLNDFCADVIKDKAFFICNSIGGLVGLQAAVMEPQMCRGIVLLNISLRMLHIKKQPWFGRPFIRSFQSLLKNTALGKLFFKSVATSESVRNILCQCYHDTAQVTEELVQKILLPGLEPGAVDVFLDFICYSDGPLPEELLPQVKCPVLIAWGDKDPWEPIELGRNYANYDPVEDFVILPNVGHCPQDEAPHLVNPIVASFVARHSRARATVSTVS